MTLLHHSKWKQQTFRIVLLTFLFLVSTEPQYVMDRYGTDQKAI